MPRRIGPTTVHCTADDERAIEAFGLTVPQLVDRHANGDWGTWNHPDAESFTRDLAALLIMLDSGIPAAKVCHILRTDIDCNTSTITIKEHKQPRPPELEALLRQVRKPENTVRKRQDGPTQRSYQLRVVVMAAVREWLARSSVESGPLFPGPVSTYLISNLMSSRAIRNEISLLSRRGIVQSRFVVEPPSVGSQLEALNVHVQTCLDSSQTQIKLRRNNEPPVMSPIDGEFVEHVVDAPAPKEACADAP